MPRQQTEAAAFLDIYKLVIEKKRLQQELVDIEARRLQIGDRLALLDQQVTGLEGRVQQMRGSAPAPLQAAPPKPTRSNSITTEFETLFLEY